MMKRRRAFAFVEIILAVLIIGILFGLIFAFYRASIEKAKYVDAVINVANIGKAEEMYRNETGEYVAAANTQEVNERLGLNIEPRWYEYKVIGVTNDNFIVLAQRIIDDINSGEISTTIARNRSGPVSPESTPPGNEEGGESGTPPGSESPGGTPGGSGGPGGGPGSGPGTTPSSPTGGGGDQRVYNNNLDNLLSLLDQSTIGHDLYNFYFDNGITASFNIPGGTGLLGEYHPYWYDDWYSELFGYPVDFYHNENTIDLTMDFITYPPEVGAATLLHELNHAYWDRNAAVVSGDVVDYFNNTVSKLYSPPLDPIVVADLSWYGDPLNPFAIWIGPDGNSHMADTIIQEYFCNQIQVRLWDEFKTKNPTLHNYNLDTKLSLYNAGQLYTYLAQGSYSTYPIYDVATPIYDVAVPNNDNQ